MSEETVMYGINFSLLSGRIYVGRVAKSGKTWTSKEDQTMPALCAVAECVERQYDGEVYLSAKDGDGPEWRVTVERIDKPAGL
jgi:hypothetical protein